MVEKTFTGPIQRQLKDALAYLKNYALKEVLESGEKDHLLVLFYHLQILRVDLFSCRFHTYEFENIGTFGTDLYV